ncbi:hypothetical protein [Candidatus Francisella endociliophora]|uniref:hypothetical protein n=1 Tax=Candidatus Francisella endociliophora TaxID=653937 RepID=UPI000694D064|nr:hypothetical protein [Francisella sp. FSC1006]
MAKIGVNISVNVNDINKAKLFKGKKGTYLNLVAFIDPDNQDQYGNNGIVKQKGDKEEDMPILGNSKVFWTHGQQQGYQNQPNPTYGSPQQETPQFDANNFDDEMIPF